MLFEINFYLNEELKQKTLNIKEIKEFGVYNKWSHRKDGTFKKFIKYGYIIQNGEKIETPHSEIIRLKKELKSNNIKFKVKKKLPIFANKKTVHGTEQRKSINWDYIIA